MDLDLETLGVLSGPGDAWAASVVRLRKTATDGRTYPQAEETKAKRIESRRLMKEERIRRLQLHPQRP